jgi:hypothetical protein
MADIQGGLPDGLRKVQEHFGDKVDLHIHDYRDRDQPKFLRGWKHLDLLRSEGDRNHVRQRLEEAIERRRSTIGDVAYRQAKGFAPGLLHGRGVGTEHAESVQETVLRRGIPEGSRQAAVLDSGRAPDKYEKNPGLADLLRSAIQPARAVAFAKLPENLALQKHPELAEAFKTLHKAERYFRGKLPSETARQQALSTVKACIQARLDEGETHGFKLRDMESAVKPQGPARRVARDDLLR